MKLRTFRITYYNNKGELEQLAVASSVGTGKDSSPLSVAVYKKDDRGHMVIDHDAGINEIRAVHKLLFDFLFPGGYGHEETSTLS